MIDKAEGFALQCLIITTNHCNFQEKTFPIVQSFRALCGSWHISLPHPPPIGRSGQPCNPTLKICLRPCSYHEGLICCMWNIYDLLTCLKFTVCWRGGKCRGWPVDFSHWGYRWVESGGAWEWSFHSEVMVLIQLWMFLWNSFLLSELLFAFR